MLIHYAQVMDEALVDLRVNHDTPVVFSDEAAATFPRSTLVLNLGRWMDKVRLILLLFIYVYIKVIIWTRQDNTTAQSCTAPLSNVQSRTL